VYIPQLLLTTAAVISSCTQVFPIPRIRRSYFRSGYKISGSNAKINLEILTISIPELTELKYQNYSGSAMSKQGCVLRKQMIHIKIMMLTLRQRTLLCIHTYTDLYIHIYIHTCIYIYIYTFINNFKCEIFENNSHRKARSVHFM